LQSFGQIVVRTQHARTNFIFVAYWNGDDYSSFFTAAETCKIYLRRRSPCTTVLTFLSQVRKAVMTLSRMSVNKLFLSAVLVASASLFTQIETHCTVLK